MEQLTVTTLRNVIGSLSLEETLTSRDKINGELRIVLDEATETLGHPRQPHRAEVDRPAGLDPGGDGEADARRARQARRDPQRRGREAVADPHRRGRAAGGDPGRGAEAGADPRGRGRPQAAILRAQGESKATQTVFAAIHAGNPTPDLLAYQYLQALPQLAEGQASSLFLIPSDVAAALGGLATMGAAFRQGGDLSAGGAPPSAS